ncbi:helix-turn-helix domain-containing protein [bacterium BD-1]|nr:helix-turn-helix domain-containing protein [Ottowia caeni]
MYEYRFDGFSVRLNSGYEVIEGKYGRMVSFSDLEGLRNAVVTALIEKDGRLTPPEAKFLRKFVEMTQVELAERLGIQPGTVSLWERGGGGVSLACDIFLRSRAVDVTNYSMAPSIAELTKLARVEKGALATTFSYVDGWQEDQTKRVSLHVFHRHRVQIAIADAFAFADFGAVPASAGERGTKRFVFEGDTALCA